MGKKPEDNRDIFEKILDSEGEYYLSPNQSIYGLIGGVVGGMAGGKALARRMASKKTRAEEAAAMQRFTKSGKDWPSGKDAKTIEGLDRRVFRGSTIGGTAGMLSGVGAALVKRPDDRRRK